MRHGHAHTEVIRVCTPEAPVKLFLGSESAGWSGHTDHPRSRATYKASLHRIPFSLHRVIEGPDVTVASRALFRTRCKLAPEVSI